MKVKDLIAQIEQFADGYVYDCRLNIENTVSGGSRVIMCNGPDYKMTVRDVRLYIENEKGEEEYIF